MRAHTSDEPPNLGWVAPYIAARLCSAIMLLPNPQRPTHLPRLPAEGPWLRAMGMQAGPLGRRRESSRIAVSSPSCEKGTVGTLHLTNQIVFAGSTVHRSRGEKHDRSLDTGALRWSRVV